MTYPYPAKNITDLVPYVRHAARSPIFFLITFFKCISHAANSEVRFACPMRTHRQLGLVFDAAISCYKEKICLFVRFFYMQPKTIKTAPFSLISKVCGHV